MVQAQFYPLLTNNVNDYFTSFPARFTACFMWIEAMLSNVSQSFHVLLPVTVPHEHCAIK